MNKRFIPLGIFFLIVASVAAIWWSGPRKMDTATHGGSRPGAVENSKVGTEVGNLAPDFNLTNIDGEKVSLSSFRGRPVMLNFWATWCPPCREEMPTMQKFFEERGREIKVLAVNLTSTEKSTEEVQRFLTANGYTFPVLLDKGDTVQQYLVRFIPTTYFIDEKGVIREKYTGPMTGQMMEAGLAKAKEK